MTFEPAKPFQFASGRRETLAAAAAPLANPPPVTSRPLSRGWR